MKRVLLLLMISLTLGLSAESLGSATSSGAVLDLSFSTVVCTCTTVQTVAVEYGLLYGDAEEGVAQILVNGEVLAAGGEVATCDWKPTAAGVYVLEHRMLHDGITTGATHAVAYFVADEGDELGVAASTRGAALDLTSRTVTCSLPDAQLVSVEYGSLYCEVENGVAQFCVNGEVLASGGQAAACDWKPTAAGVYVLEHRTLQDDCVTGNVYAVTYLVTAAGGEMGSATATAGVALDLTEEVVSYTCLAAQTVPVEYGSLYGDVEQGEAQFRVNGEVLASGGEVSTYDWKPTEEGTYVLEHSMMVGDCVTGTVLSVMHVVTPHPLKHEPVAGVPVVLDPQVSSVSGTVTWSAKGLPAGMRIAAKDLTDKTYGNVPAGTIYGTPTKPGTYVVKVTAKGTTSETFEVPVVVGNFVDELIPVADRYETYRVGAKMTLDLSDFADCTVSGLPSGLKFAKKATTDKDFGTIAAGMVYGIPTKACTNTVTFTKSVSENVGGKTKKVTHKASATFVVAAAPTWAVGTFNGRRDDGEGGVATMTVGATGKISGKIITGGKTWSFSASGFEAVDEGAEEIEELQIVAGAKNGKETRTVRLTVTASGAEGVFCDGEGAVATLTLWRNEWKDKGATDKLKDFVGLYTVQLACSETGYGYLSLTLDAKGNCKAAGKLPDGTSASGSLPLVWVRDGGEVEEWKSGKVAGVPMAIWQMTPSAYKGGCAGGLLKWGGTRSVASAADTEVGPPAVEGADVVWVSQAPGATGEYGAGFSRTMSASGAWYNKLATLSAYYTSLAFNADTPTLDATVKTTDLDGSKKVTTSETVGIDAVALDCWGALTLSVDTKGTGFVVDQGKATKPVQDKKTKVWSYTGANDAALTFGFTKATGIFKGTFTCWYDYVSATDNTKDPAKETLTHTSKKVSYEGVMLLGEALRGYYLWERTGAYEDEKTGKKKTYKYKESRPVAFE